MSLIKGIGVDIVQIARFEKLNDRTLKRFSQRVLNEAEAHQYQAFGHHKKVCWLAKRFAAKESVLKALGTGLAQGIRFHDIIISNDSIGKPEVRLVNQALLRLSQLEATQVNLSISDEKEYAVAFSIIS